MRCPSPTSSIPWSSASIGGYCSVILRSIARRLPLIALAALLAGTVAACGGSAGSSSNTTWSNLTRVTVDVTQPGVNEPPGGGAKPVVFSTPAQLRRVTRALNATHLQLATATSSSNGCAGGLQIAITIKPRSGTPTKLSAYRCANTTTGDVAGNLDAFLKRVGVNLP